MQSKRKGDCLCIEVKMKYSAAKYSENFSPMKVWFYLGKINKS
jgi:hypothetical protein